ncbi:NADH dehydrogenase [Methanobrevibacter cuticularis]|uniref:NADH dehydrogenase n=1 Tax=Methanobrevibacter cuticularis TaxID=47311 RepID=A0A166FL71_9EURY|nr:nitroreductase family protein [Methanobrevibacter cuticularis]KZX17791.1 NADH dehydrogenase [Methanobrevibacter cuticularis]
MEEIFKRRSIRKYREDEIEDEKIDKLIRAAMQAPGSRLTKEPWEFIIVKNKDTIDKLSEMDHNSKMLEGASLAIVLIANMDTSHFHHVWQQDMAAASTTLLLEASYLDLGAVWVNIAPNEKRMEYIRKLFNLTENLRPFNIISIGYPAEGQENKFLDKYHENRVHYEEY